MMLLYLLLRKHVTFLRYIRTFMWALIGRIGCAVCTLLVFVLWRRNGIYPNHLHLLLRKRVTSLRYIQEPFNPKSQFDRLCQTEYPLCTLEQVIKKSAIYKQSLVLWRPWDREFGVSLQDCIVTLEFTPLIFGCLSLILNMWIFKRRAHVSFFWHTLSSFLLQNLWKPCDRWTSARL